MSWKGYTPERISREGIVNNEENPNDLVEMLRAGCLSRIATALEGLLTEAKLLNDPKREEKLAAAKAAAETASAHEEAWERRREMVNAAEKRAIAAVFFDHKNKDDFMYGRTVRVACGLAGLDYSSYWDSDEAAKSIADAVDKTDWLALNGSQFSTGVKTAARIDATLAKRRAEKQGI